MGEQDFVTRQIEDLSPGLTFHSSYQVVPRPETDENFGKTSEEQRCEGLFTQLGELTFQGLQDEFGTSNVLKVHTKDYSQVALFIRSAMLPQQIIEIAS